MKTYYIIEFKDISKSYFYIWFTNDIDGFLVKNGEVVLFSSYEDAKEYCRKSGFLLEQPLTYYDIAEIRELVIQKRGSIENDKILDFWNIMIDFSKSINKAFEGSKEEYNRIYDKLFFGNNLPSINTTKETYIPKWSDKEKEMIYNVLRNGLFLLNVNSNDTNI